MEGDEGGEEWEEPYSLTRGVSSRNRLAPLPPMMVMNDRRSIVATEPPIRDVVSYVEVGVNSVQCDCTYQSIGAVTALSRPVEEKEPR